MPESSSGGDKGRKSKRQKESRKRVSRVEQVSSSPVIHPEMMKHPGETLPGSDFSQATFERHAALLGDNSVAGSMHARQRATIVRQLQRDYGNHYVQRLVDHITRKQAERAQTKLKVGPAGDRYEREADSVAKQVVKRTGHGRPNEADALSQVASRDSSSEFDVDDVQLEPLDVQKQGLTSEEEEELLQAKPLDILRQELTSDEDEEPLQTKRLDIQRQDLTSDEEEYLLQAKPLGVLRQVGLEGGPVEPDIESDINAARGHGQALPDTLRESMETSFSADFGGVRLHSDANSDALNENLNSRAFTVGQDIFVRRQDYSLTSAESRELLAHELTHVLQQSGQSVRRDDDQTAQPEKKKFGVTAAAEWGVEKLEKGVGWVSEHIIEAGGSWAKTWLQKKLYAAWVFLRKKFPWLATFFEGVFGVAVNVTELGWSGLKLIARIAWFVLKAFGKSVFGNIGKAIDVVIKFLSGKSWEEMDLFNDTRAWYEDFDQNQNNPFLELEGLSIWTGNARDVFGWIALISGLLALIPPLTPVLGTISGATGIITLILSAAAPLFSTVALLGDAANYVLNLSLGKPVEDAKNRMKRLIVLAVGDVSSLVGALIGMSTEGIANETVKQSTGAIIGGFTEGTGELAKEPIEDYSTKGMPISEVWEKIRAKGEGAWQELFKNFNRLINLVGSVGKILMSGFRLAGGLFLGIGAAVGGVIDLVTAAKSKKETGTWDLKWDKANAVIGLIDSWDKWEKEKFFPGFWKLGDFVGDVMEWLANEKGNLFKKSDQATKTLKEVGAARQWRFLRESTEKENES